MTEHLHTTARQFLAESLTKRTPTWSVAEQILQLDLPGMPDTLRAELDDLAHSGSWTYEMHDDFDRVDPADTQLATLAQLFPQVDISSVNVRDAQALTRPLVQALETLGGPPNAGAGWLLAAHQQRRLDLTTASGLSRAAVTKRLRFLRRYEEKVNRVLDTTQLRHAQMQAKSRFAYAIDASACDDITLAFCAYLASRANRRSIFQFGEQSRAQDTVSSGLETLLERNPRTNWEQVAKVKPTVGVIARAEPAARGRLLGFFHAAMTVAAYALRDLYDDLPERMRDEMVMVRGVDSSRWNAYAGALNTMRSAWISAILAADLGEVLDSYCPGKAPRLMAADLVWGYRNQGKELHVDTKLFNALPFPWEVITGNATLGRAEILRTAAAVAPDADAEKSGWVGPRAPREREKAAAEPALVHGVVVADPQLARTLRRCGVFSAKQLRHTDELPDAILRADIVDGDRVTPTVLGSVENLVTGDPTIAVSERSDRS